MALTVDDVMDKIGSFERYQYRLLFIFGFMKIFGDAFQLMIPTFLSIEPPWRCKDNSSVCNLTGIFKPGDDYYNFRCSIPRDDWEFDTSEIVSSVVTEFDLVCNVSALSALNKAITFVGYMIGVLIGSVLSDKFGRKSMVYFLSVMCNILALATSFSQVYWLYVSLRCLVGMCIGSSSLSMYVLLTEYVGKRHRDVVGISLWYFWVISLMLLALFAYLIRDWRTLSIVGAVPGLLQIFFWWFIPESPRWLLVKNKPEQAWKELQKVADFNKKEMPDEKLEQKDGTAQRTGDFRDLFSSVNMTKRTLISWFSWMVISLVYYAVAISAGTFGGNRYLVFFLSSLVEIPSNWISIVLCRRIGRKKTTVLGVIASFIASVIAVFFQRDLKNTGFLVANIIMSQGFAKFFITMAYDAIYVYSSELFPTVVRNIGLGSSAASARVGSILASYIVWLVRIHILLPYSIVAVFTFVCAALCFLLPETRDTATLENMDSVNSNATEMTEKEQVPCVPSKQKEELGELLLNSGYLA